MTHTIDQAEASIAYRVAFSFVHERLTLARLAGRSVDLERLMAELADVCDTSHPAVVDAVRDALAERPSREV